VGIGNRSPNGNYVAIQVTKQGWDSDRGCEGEIPLHGEHPLRHPKLARTGRHYNDLGDRTDTSSDDRDVGRIDTLSVIQVRIGSLDPEPHIVATG